jgi:hypothetical protein
MSEWGEDGWKTSEPACMEEERCEHCKCYITECECPMESLLAQLRDSLWKLANEVSGVVGFADKELTAIVGHTNMAILKMRVADARAVLETTKGKS